MAWDPDDVARSVRRYLSLTLDGPPWRIRTERREVRDDDRPVAVIDAGESAVTRSREGTVYQGEVEWVIPVTITAYPELLATGKEKEGRHDAELLRGRLQRLILHGVPVNAGGRLWSGPFRIPLWDYSSTVLSGAGKAGPEVPHDVIFIPRESLNTRILQDPEDARRFAVIAEFRASVEGPGRTAPVAPDPEAVPVTSIDGTFVPPP